MSVFIVVTSKNGVEVEITHMLVNFEFERVFIVLVWHNTFSPSTMWTRALDIYLIYIKSVLTYIEKHMVSNISHMVRSSTCHSNKCITEKMLARTNILEWNLVYQFVGIEIKTCSLAYKNQTDSQLLSLDITKIHDNYWDLHDEWSA